MESHVSTFVIFIQLFVFHLSGSHRPPKNTREQYNGNTVGHHSYTINTWDCNGRRVIISQFKGWVSVLHFLQPGHNLLWFDYL